MQKLKNLVKRFIKKDSFIYRVIRKIYHTLSTAKNISYIKYSKI